MDAAVAVSSVLAVVAPHLGGFGGDFFALVKTPDGSIHFFNGSGQAPARLTLGLLRELGYTIRPPERGPLSPTVPGMIGGLYLMWKRLGSLEWSDLLRPAARLAREGFPAPTALASAIRQARPLLVGDPGSRATYLARPPATGGLVRFEGLARLIEGVAEEGPVFFYKGDPARAIEEYLAGRGGVLSSGDLAAYDPLEGDPLELGYKGWRLQEMPPNTQGATALHIMAALEPLETPRNPLARLPAIMAAAQPAYELRDREIGDPATMKLAPQALLEHDVVESIRDAASKGPRPCRGSRPAGASGDTTFYVVVDREGMVVAGIQSLFYSFGSGLTEPTYQVTLNGRAAGFTLEEGLPSTLAPGRRPLHTLSAVIAEGPAGETLALGTSGGHLRPQQHALLLTSMIDHAMTPGEAIAAPRSLWVPGSCRIVADPAWESAAAAWAPPRYSVVAGRTGVAAAALRLGGGGWLLATDPRGDGYPVAAV